MKTLLAYLSIIVCPSFVFSQSPAVYYRFDNPNTSAKEIATDIYYQYKAILAANQEAAKTAQSNPAVRKLVEVLNLGDIKLNKKSDQQEIATSSTTVTLSDVDLKSDEEVLRTLIYNFEQKLGSQDIPLPPSSLWTNLGAGYDFISGNSIKVKAQAILNAYVIEDKEDLYIGMPFIGNLSPLLLDKADLTSTAKVAQNMLSANDGLFLDFYPLLLRFGKKGIATFAINVGAGLQLNSAKKENEDKTLTLTQGRFTAGADVVLPKGELPLQPSISIQFKLNQVLSKAAYKQVLAEPTEGWAYSWFDILGLIPIASKQYTLVLNGKVSPDITPQWSLGIMIVQNIGESSSSETKK